MGALDSLDALLAADYDYGDWRRAVAARYLTQTTPVATAGNGLWLRRAPLPITVPTITTPLVGAYLVTSRFYSGADFVQFCVLEYLLGTLNVATNAYTAGVTMPTKAFRGSSIQTASLFTIAVVTVAVGATGPTISFTYTDQDGTTGKTGSIGPCPNSASVNTAFPLGPHLATDSLGVRAITAASRSAGTATGSVAFYGTLLLGITGNFHNWPNLLDMPIPEVLLEQGDALNFYMSSAQTSAVETFGFIKAVGTT